MVGRPCSVGNPGNPPEESNEVHKTPAGRLLNENFGGDQIRVGERGPKSQGVANGGVTVADDLDGVLLGAKSLRK